MRTRGQRANDLSSTNNVSASTATATATTTDKSTTAAEVSRVVTTAIIPPVSVPINNRRRRRSSGRGRGRGRRRKRAKKLTTAEKTKAQEAHEELKKHRLEQKYKRKLQCKLMELVESLDLNGGERFLRPAVQENGWEYHKTLDINKIEEDQDGFFTIFSLFLASLMHHKLTDKDGNAIAVLHDTLRRYVTAVNNCWKYRHRVIPRKLASLCSDLLASKKKKETKMNSRVTFQMMVVVRR